MVGVLVAVLAGCNRAVVGPPAIVIDRTACARCGMLVSEVRYAAAAEIDGAPRIFDDIGCLLHDLQASTRPPGRLWFHDAVTGEWIDTPPAFIRATSIRTPMGGGILAFSSIEAARAAAAERRASLIASTDALLTEVRP